MDNLVDRMIDLQREIEIEKKEIGRLRQILVSQEFAEELNKVKSNFQFCFVNKRNS